MIRSLYYSPGKPIRKDIPPQEFTKLIRDRRSLLWVDFVNEPDENSLPILQGFGFHSLSIEDALQQTHSPKLDDWGNYLYIVMNYMDVKENGKLWESDVDELDIFLGPNYIVTHHEFPIPAIDETWASCDRDVRNVQEGADHLLYKIMDFLVAGYMPTVERIDSAIDELEDHIFDKPSPRTLERLFALKRVLLAMRRILLPQREVLNKLARDDYRVIDPKDRIFFRDIYDHLVRLHDLNENLRDLVGGALDTYLSVVNNRMNDIMKTLTIITTIFMPLAFVTGFFGMNFFEPQGRLTNWTTNPIFYITLAINVLLPIGMYLWMRRRTWI
ncbi:MAG: Cobalt/magnesium transport protein CorA [Anaerolineales bacterium]|nr:magnesium/cobalt transporter CorA [Anaerolineae bacterium]MBL8104424.1 magnesium/cobalt transporter CorA [Anaerolineales bacterium]MBV6403249.1 Cobalt/magnesium transport protein CorA [Anaerolineales bacterium]MCC7187596.1 magnesium/cobalt transporter CorA [Anaerolineales bacterium]